MSNYIEFYFDDKDKFNAKIHKDGKYRIVSNEKNLLKLLEISAKNGYRVNHEGIIRKKAKQITKEYDKYTKRKKRLQIFGKIAENMVLSRKNPLLGKTVIAATILATIALSGIDNKSIGVDTKEISTPTSSSVTQEEETSIKYMKDTNIDFENIEILDTENEKEQSKNNSKEELNRMLESPTFHFSYEDRTSNASLNKAKRYEDIFEKYAARYGLDKNLLIALAAQESSGEHYEHIESGPACGIMQIEKAIHIGTTISAYNFDTQQMEKVEITADKLKDIDSNIQIGSMILRNYIENNNYNIPLSLQTYNFGPGNMTKVLETCSDLEKVDVNQMRNNPTNNKWLNYRAFLNIGDSKYVEHVFSFLNNNSELTVLKRDNSKVSINITNDYTNAMQK